MVTTFDDQTIDAVLARMQQRIDALPTDLAHRRIFASTYLRTTEAVGAAIDDARFEDPAWVENWDVVFADLFLDAHDADRDGRRATCRGPGGWPSTRRPTCRRCGTCCWASTRT